MALFKCKMCGGTLEINNNETVAVCEYCGTQQTLPKLDDEKRANLYDRANHFRRNNEFDKAMGIYEQILNEDATDAEAYWSLVLCSYGIEYVEDPSSHKRIPTVNRAQLTSVFDDGNYKSALQYADTYQRSIYEEEAKAINEILKGILAIYQKAEPFDVFICYKETDNNGRRTPDSVLANDLYYQLTQEGFKVFFARITLEDKLGSAYEPYIFAALNSAKVMVVLGTKQEYFNAVWVKNEWSRYLALIKQGQKKMLIPAYRDMDPYDLPEQFSHLQAQDMSKLGFMQDLIRGIKKIVAVDAPKVTVVKETVVSGGNSNTASLLKRAFIFLEDGDWASAEEYCEKVLDLDPECAQAYLGKLMSEYGIKKQEELKDIAQPFDDNNNFQKAIRFADRQLRDTLSGYIAHIKNRNESARMDAIYSRAEMEMNHAAAGDLNKAEAAYKEAADLFESISTYKDSAALAKDCREKAETARKDAILAEAKVNGEYVSKYEAAIKLLETIPGWKDADELLIVFKNKADKAETIRKDAILANAKEHMTRGIAYYYEAAIKQLESIPGWKDADELLAECNQKIREFETKAEEEWVEREWLEEATRLKAARRAKVGKQFVAITGAVTAIIILLNTVIVPASKYKQAMSLLKAEDAADNTREILAAFDEAGYWADARKQAAQLRSALAPRNTLAAGENHTVGLKADGTVVAVGETPFGQCNVSSWKEIVSIAAGNRHTVGLKEDGTVVAVGINDSGQCDVSRWTDIVAVAACDNYTLGLKSGGTVVATGYIWLDALAKVSAWRGIVAVAAGDNHAVGLKSDGTVVALGDNDYGQCNVSKWTDIVAVAAGGKHTVGLKADGTVVAVGDNDFLQCNVYGWTDIVAVDAERGDTVGLKSDGTVIFSDSDSAGKSIWQDVVTIAAGEHHTVGLKADGTVVATGDNYFNQCNVSKWRNIKVLD